MGTHFLLCVLALHNTVYSLVMLHLSPTEEKLLQSVGINMIHWCFSVYVLLVV